ncbi:MAG: malonyl-[acyl-carrier protein] O-methyltransferase BioC, partial [Gammaproteobacteria bacterium]
VLETERISLPYRAPADALREIHRAGCGNALAARPRGLMGRQKWQNALAEYARLFCGKDGRARATYEIIYAAAWRKPPPGESPLHFVKK